MKEVIRRSLTLFSTLLLALLLQSCGGSGNNTPKHSISASVSKVTFSNEFLKTSDDTIEITVNYQGNGLLVGFAPDAQPAAWLNYRTGEVTDTSATIFIDVINAEFLPPELYSTTLRLSTGDPAGPDLVNTDIDISLLVWQLDTNKERVSFGAPLGVSEIAAQSLELTGEYTDNGVKTSWQASVDVPWLTLDKTEGLGNDVITITPDVSSFTQSGLQQANLTLTETTTGDKKIIPIELGLDNIYLYADQANIAFTDTPNNKAISKTVTINSNSPTTLNWQATADVDWLVVTPIAESNQLKISVDETIMPQNAQSFANIIINDTATDSNVISETIHIGLYTSSQKTSEQTFSDIQVNDNALVADPLSPLTYIAVNNELRVYHQYTGALINTVAISPENTLLEQLVIHPDGSLMLAQADETVTDADGNETIITHRYQIQLADFTVTEFTDTDIEFDPNKIVRFAGRYFVVTQTLEFADLNLQRLYWDQANAYFARTLDQAKSTDSLYALDGSNNHIKRYTAAVNDFISDTILPELTHDYLPESLGENDAISAMVVDNNEQNIYLASPTTEWLSFDGNQFSDNGLLETNTEIVTLLLSKTDNGRPLYLRFDPNKGFIGQIYNESQQLSATFTAGTLQATGIKLSADGLRLIGNATISQTVSLTAVNQFEVDKSALTFLTTFNNANIAQQQVALSGLASNWQASSNVDWLTLTPDNSGDSSNLLFNIDKTKINNWGLFTGEVTVYDPASDSYLVISVSFAVDAIRLYANYPALGFFQQNSSSKLTQTVAILSNAETIPAWTATTDETWLTLTPDNTNNTLTISVDPSKVSTDGLHNAVIQISPVTDNAAETSNIQISYLQQASDASSVTLNNISPNSDALVVDNQRPYIYLAQGDEIQVINLLDGSSVANVSSPISGADLTNLVITPDSSMLLASNSESVTDENGNTTTKVHHYQIDLTNYTINEITTADIDFKPSTIVQIAGKPVVVTQTQEFASLDLKRQFWDQSNAFFASNYAHAANSNAILTHQAGTSELNSWTLFYNDYASEKIHLNTTSTSTNNEFLSSAPRALALNNSGDTLYSAHSSSEWSVLQNDTYTDQGILHSGIETSLNVVTDSQNHSYFYRLNPLFGFTLTEYDENQNQVSAKVISLNDSQSYISPNYRRIATLNSNTNVLTITSF